MIAALDTLLEEVDAAVRQVKIYVYEPPRNLLRALELQKTGSREYFKLETELLARVRALAHAGGGVQLVSNPEKADFFWVPHTFIAHWIDSRGAVTQEYWREGFKPFLRHIAYDMPFFNRSSGRNHLIVWPMDHGPVCDCMHAKLDRRIYLDPIYQEVVLSMVHIGYHGMVGGPTEHDLSVYDRNRQKGKAEKRAFNATNPLRTTCFLPGHDIAVPQWNDFHLRESAVRSVENWRETLKKIADRAKQDLYFRGAIWSGSLCSPGIRPWVQQYCERLRKGEGEREGGKEGGKEGFSCSETEMGTGVFALCPAGWACWSSRLYDAIDALSVPVVLADPVVQPFERFVDWTLFSEKPDVAAALVMDPDAAPNGTAYTTWAGSGGIVGAVAQKRLFRHCVFERLHQSAAQFRALCGGDPRPTDACTSHPISQKLQALAGVREWFSWDIGHSSGKSAVKLFLAELYCRTERGRGSELCAAPSAAVANRPHGQFMHCV